MVTGVDVDAPAGDADITTTAIAPIKTAAKRRVLRKTVDAAFILPS
jgi:predicted secreted protein